MNKETKLMETTVNDTAQDVGDATQLTEGFGGYELIEPTTDDYYQP